MKQRKTHKILVIISACAIVLCGNSHIFSSISETGVLKVYLQSDRIVFMQGEPVELSIVVKNNSHTAASYQSFDIWYTTFQPVAYYTDGREVQTNVNYRLAGKRVQEVVNYIEPRITVIQPDEKLIKRVNLEKAYDLKPGCEYRVYAFFMPDARNDKVVRSENSITIRIDDIARESDAGIEIPVPYSGGIVPSEVLQLMLYAEKNRNWKNMVKYIDLEHYINVFPDYGMKYASGNDPVRKTVMRDFVAYITNPRFDYIMDYSIIRETILDDKNTAYVDAKVVRYAAPKPFVYLYRYTLLRIDGTWRVASVDATVSKERILAP